MGKKLWNYVYSLLLSVILLLLIGIFLNLNSNVHKIENNALVSNKEMFKEYVDPEYEQPISEKQTIFLYDIIDQKTKELPLFNKFIIDRKREEVKARVAIIIDDMGYQKEIAEQVMSLNFPVAISVLPFLPYSRMVAQMARERGFTVLLHLPMEPHNSNTDPGKGAIFTTMTEQGVKAKILADLQEIPDIDGVNNHMGSKATEDDYIMKIVLNELKERNLFFIDSMTSPYSVGYKLSKEMGIKTAQRTVFLDNEQDVDYIRNQIMVLKEYALKYGSAIAIGHPYCNTINVLIEVDLLLQSEGIEIVPIEELLE